jgi:hypothetical protein
VILLRCQVFVTALTSPGPRGRLKVFHKGHEGSSHRAKVFNGREAIAIENRERRRTHVPNEEADSPPDNGVPD